MVGGVERYYQVAKCFRDEDLRADPQPEFTQVDIEMSFVDQNDVMSALEEVLADAFGRMGVEMPTPLRRMNYWDAMDTYGSDKPDTRYGMHLVDLTDIFRQLQVQGLCDCRKRGRLCRQGYQRQGRRCLGTCQDR